MKTTLFTLLAAAAVSTLAQITTYNPPKLVPFAHVNLTVNLPYNVTTIWGDAGYVANRAGNVTGNLVAEILPVGDSYEVLPPATNGTLSFYTNTLLLNTTSGAIISLHTEALITYANNALHGWGTVKFQTAAPEYIDLNWRSFVAESESDFFTGIASIDIFELETGGRRDGGPVLALLPPGQGAARR